LSAYLKPVLVLVISILLFAGAAYLIDTELVNYVQRFYYNPSVLNTVITENQYDAELVQNHVSELQAKFAATLDEPVVRSSFLYNQNAEDIFERSRIYGILLETVSGLQSVQFVDSNGIRIHFSTSTRDILSQNRESTAYRNYTEDNRALPYDRISIPAHGQSKITMDDFYDRIIYSYPFYDSMDVYRGTACFTLSVRALAEKLIAEGRLKANEDISIIGIPPGVVIGYPDTSKTDILNKVSDIWQNSLQDIITLDAEDSGVQLALISTKTGQNLYFGRLINNSIFYISDSMKYILYLSMFVTFYLTLFFMVNFKPNPATLVRNRIKKLTEKLFKQLYVNKNDQDRVKWILELEQRRNEIHLELKHNLKVNKKTEKKINSIIDKAWDELLAVMKSDNFKITPAMIRDIHKTEDSEKVKTPDETAELIEDIDEIEEIDDVETLDEIEAEEIDEVEALEDLDEIEEIGEIEEIEEVEMLEDIDEIEEIEEVEALEEIDELEEVEALEELDELEEFETLEEIDEIEVITAGGLLKLASKYEKGKKLSVYAPKGLLKLASKYGKKEKPAFDINKGLYALASEYGDKKRPTLDISKGLYALASEIEFNSHYPVHEPDEPEVEIDTELDIVSPFSSMFTSLYDE
jgi:hypothetical protein